LLGDKKIKGEIVWRYNGRSRPAFAITPQSGQESVWDYPRPPKLVRDGRRVEVLHKNQIIATSNRCYRVLETASPPAFYIPADDILWTHLVDVPGSSVCEWKGVARYWALATDPSRMVGWSYPDPLPGFEAIRAYVSFYPVQVACFVAGEKVRAQPGKFYGGWITAEIIGSFKGEPGTGHW